jgi:hypothetical protein
VHTPRESIPAPMRIGAEAPADKKSWVGPSGLTV